MAGDLITYPVTQDPMEIPKKPEAPRDPAVGGYQVFLHNGAFFTNDVDINLPAPAIPVLWARHWRGQVDFSEGGLLGYGWDFSFNKRIVPIAPRKTSNGLFEETAGVDQPQLVYYDGNGHAETHFGKHSEIRQVHNFDRTFNAYVTTYQGPPGFFHEIERYIVLGPHATHPFAEHPNVEPMEAIFYVLREKNGTRFVFNCRGQLIYVLSRHDNNLGAGRVRLELHYAGKLSPLTQNTMLSAIIDPVGRVYKVGTVDMHSGAIWTNIKCQLVSGVAPIPHVKSIQGNGLDVEYSYQGGDSEPVLESVSIQAGGSTRKTAYAYDGGHRIVSITDPNETAKGGGRPFLTNRYGGDKVVAQTLGDIPFTISYGGAGGATVTDANGVERVYALTTAGKYPVAASSTVRGRDGRQWKTSFEHNDDTQVTRVTEPRGNGHAYTYEGANRPVTIGPILDWFDRGLTYENNLARGNVIAVTRFGVGGGGWTSRQSYDLLYNQPSETIEPGGLKASASYGYDVHGERGEPLVQTFPKLLRADGSLVERPSTRNTYNSRGQVLSVDQGDGKVTRYTYDPGKGFLTRVDRADGSHSDFQYDGVGNITQEDSTRGREQMQYDGRGLLTQRVIDPDGANITTRYRYNPDGHPIESRLTIKDVFGSAGGGAGSAPAPRPSYERVVTTEYDILNRPTRETISGGNDRTYRSYEYSRDGTVKRIRSSPLNSSDEYVVEYEYDPRGLVTAIRSAAGTPAESRKTIAYDANGNESDVTENQGAPAFHMEYDGVDQLATQTSTPGGEQKFEYDERGYVKHASITGRKRPDGDAETLYAADFMHDAYGNLIHKAVDTLDGGTESSTWTYDPHLRLESTIAPNGGVTRFQYDLGDRVRLATDPVGNQVETVYDPAGNPTATRRRVKERRFVPAKNAFEDRTTVYESRADFDRLGRISAAYATDGSLRESYLYDSEGNPRFVFRAGEGPLEYIYDGLGRRQAVRQPNGLELTRYTPGGLVAELEYGRQHVRNEYDAAGRRVREIDVNTGQSSTFTYDPRGRALRTTDRNGTVVDFGYEGGGLRRTISVTPSGMVSQYKDEGVDREVPAVTGATKETYETDALGQVVSARTDLGVKVDMAYDGLGRVVLETQTLEGDGQTIARRFAPDLSWSEVTYPPIAGGVTVRRDFDLLGRTTSVKVDGKAMASYVYAAPERLAARLTANDWLTRYDYNTLEQPAGISLAHRISGSSYTPLWTESLGYDGVGRLISENETFLPLGRQTARSTHTALAYDSRGRSVRSQTQESRPGGGENEFSESGMLWNYDDRGNVAAIGEWGGGGAETSVAAVRLDTYGYDVSGQVASVATVGRRDMVGKSVPTRSGSEFGAFVGDLSGTTTDTQTFKYDNQGNLLADGRFVYSYDYRGRLTRVVDRWAPFRYGESIRFRYDPLGRRVASLPMRDRVPGGLVQWGSEWNRGKQRYLYDGSGAIADVWLGPGAEPPDWDSPRMKAEPRLIGRYFRGAQPGEILRMDRRAEDQPNEDLRVFYLHQEMGGRVRFASDLYSMLPSAILDDVPPPGQAAPGQPPEDRDMIEGTQVRVPYLNGRLRVDGFAGTRYQEDLAAAAVDYRSAWGYRAAVEHDVLRDERIAQQNRLQMESGVYIAAMAAPAFAGSAASLGAALYENGFIAGAFQNAVVAGASSVGYSAIAAARTGNAYSLGEATDDFASAAGMAALSYGVGAGIGSLGLGKVGSFLATTFVNNWLIPSGQLMLQGMDPGDAITADAVSRALYTAADIGIAVGEPYARSALTRAGAKLKQASASNPAGGGRPAQATQKPRTEYWVDRLTTEQEQDTTAVYKAKTEDMKAADQGVLSAMTKDSRHARAIARLVRNGEFQIAYYRNHSDPRLASAYGYHMGGPKTRGTLFINLDTIGWEPGNGVISINRYKMASVVVHEGAHALGGSEVVAFIAEAKFMMSTARRKLATRDEISQWFGKSGRLINLYKYAKEGENFGMLRSYIMVAHGYSEDEMRISLTEHEAVTRAGGYNSFLGFTDPMLDVYERALQTSPNTYLPKPPGAP